ncbi:hypothetical protein JCM16303_003260 [Sporobolomyces ruberrimus]
MVVCRHFNKPGGCSFGSNCRFEHPSSASNSTSSTTSANQTNWRQSRGDAPRLPQPFVPRGICRNFYTTGACDRFASGDCRYKHEASQPKATGAFRSKPEQPSPATPADLTSAAKGVNSDSISPLTSGLRVDRSVLFKVANDVDFKFLDPVQVYPWVNSLYASTQVKIGVSTHEESQNALAALANPDGPGMARVVELLNFPFGTNVGHASTTKTLSFQRGFMPFVAYLTSGEIRSSVFSHHLNRLYHALHIHSRAWVNSTLACLDTLMAEKSVKDPRLSGRFAGYTPENFVQVFAPLVQLLQEYLSRFSDAVVKNPEVQELLTSISSHFATYREAVSSDSTSFNDVDRYMNPRQRGFVLEGVRQSITMALKVVERTQVVPFVATVPQSVSTNLLSAAALAALKRLFEPPGALRTSGPRHDNDNASIKEIRILPTHQELLAPRHRLPSPREDFVGPLRAAVSSIVNDLEDLQDPKNSLGALLRRGGGRYRPVSSVHADSSDLNVYSNAEFAGINLSAHHELQLRLELDFPKSFGRSHVARHLTPGNLVGLICRRKGTVGREGGGPLTTGDARIFLGLVSTEPASVGIGRKGVGITFFEGELYLEALQQFEAQQRGIAEHSEMICFEVPGFLLGTLKPFLKALQGIEPPTLPFAKYLSALPPPADSPIKLDAPLFARTPGFTYDLSGSLEGHSPPDSLVLDINDKESVRVARQVLTESSRLDASQADAMVDALGREVALIRGPPGTGKSFLGVELIRTLLNAKVGRILVLSYTNHALDTMLRHLKHQVTKKLVRAGSRSQDPEMEEFNLNQLAFEQSRHQGRIDHETRTLLGWIPNQPNDIFAWWRDGGDLTMLEGAQAERDATTAALAEQRERLAQQTFKEFELLGIEGSDSGQSSQSDEDSPGSSVDIPSEARHDPDSDKEEEDSEGEESEEDRRYLPPGGNRSVAELEIAPDVWGYSREERARIVEAWADDLVKKEGPHLDDLRRLQEDVNARIKALNNDAKLRVLKSCEVVGATTNSAANLLEIISAAEPVVLVVEEAGECLEAQVLANLVPSIQQLIMIGDEKQLRPQISSYHLSVDSSQGSAHRHDVSLFERLATLPIPVSMLRTQRRMRPEISSLIRNFLYPDLEDAQQVLEYPDVKGMSKNVFFVDHRLSEDSQAAEHSSKSNTQEATFVVDLVRHLLRQGYKGQIAVVVPYLGQLSTLKRELEKEAIAVAIDERDAEDLAAAQERAAEDSDDSNDLREEEISFVPAQATLQTLKSQIDLRTIDRFQGEEADVVILSLVRNSASTSQDDEPTFFNLDRAAKSSIGFLKSFNRTNVAVSRAKHGMYFFGDAQLLAEKSQMWRSIVNQLEEQDLVGPVLPARCENHPDTLLRVDRPGVLPNVAPEGGCLERCAEVLGCGHSCPRVCHVSDSKPCNILPTEEICTSVLTCGHRCPSLSSEDCGRQVCPKCATPERQGDIVDYITLDALGDFDENEQDPSARLITIDCGHSLSVGTLDGLFEMDLFYRKDADGKLVGLAHPETSDKVPPRCPSCTTPITSKCVRRYGRSLKHREATVQERLWTIRGQLAVADSQGSVAALPTARILERAKSFKVRANGLGRTIAPVSLTKHRQRHFLDTFQARFVPPEIYANPNFTGLSGVLHRFWSGAVHPLLVGLYRICEASRRRSPQSRADPVRDLDRAALEFAHTAAGIAPPTVDLKLHLQHVWLSLDIRFAMADVAAELAESLWRHSPAKNANHQALVNLATFVYKAARRDVELTIEAAHNRKYGRLEIEGHLHLLRVRFEASKFSSHAQLSYGFAARPAVVRAVESDLQQALFAFDEAIRAFPSESSDNSRWLDDNILPNREKNCDQWNSVLRYARGETVYTPVTDEERRMVIQSQGFAASGHCCPNGHTYAIGDCGGADSQGRCPECGAVIGGHGHRVAEGNHHDDRMIRLAEAEVGARAYFPWGRQ